MRRRRAERCLVRAEQALSAGLLDEARAATDEARELDPASAAIAEMDGRLEGALLPQDLLLRPPPVEGVDGSDSEEKARRSYVGPVLMLAVGCLALVSASLGWRAVLLPESPPALKTALRGDVTLAADPVVDPQLETAEPPAVLPDPEPPPAEPATVSTTGLNRPPAAIPARTDAGPPARSASASSPGSAARSALETTASRRETGAGPMPAPDKPSNPIIPEPTAARGPEPTAARSLEPTAARDMSPAATPRDVGALPPPRQEPVPLPKAPVVEAVPLAAGALGSSPSIPVTAPAATTAPSALTRPRGESVAPNAASGIDPRTAVRATLARYEAAYSGLNVSAARAVWPAVDARALARAFDGLASQRVALDRCDVTVNGTTARALCSGTAEWTPKVGGGERRQNRHWAFDLRNAAGGWQIVRADAR
jgi:hypothetical protein